MNCSEKEEWKMKFKISFAVDSSFIGPVIEACCRHPIEELNLTSTDIDELLTATATSQLQQPSNTNQAIKKQTKKRHFSNGAGKKPTVKEAITNFLRGKEPQTMNSIREGLRNRGFNPNSIPSSFQVLKDIGRVKLEDGDESPQRYYITGE
jgi:hypothetical protein